MGAAIQPQPFGKYFLLERIATGGMAEIYKAKYRVEGGFEKTLVIKKILPHLSRDQEFITMFRDEAALTVRLNHANIVQVFDFGRTGEDYFLAMEYVQGQNFRGVMRRCQELGAAVPIPFALFAVTEVAKGLSYAHSRRDDKDDAMQIVHRDITPSNILVSYEGEFKIADFGIAKAASRASGTQAGMIKGKASYLAPEQVAGQAVDGRADLFALGAVLWEAVVGRKLFSGDSDFEIMNKITNQQVPRPSTINQAIPPEVETIIMHCLERDPKDRYQNAAALQKDLSQLLNKLAPNVTTVDISSFLRRLFKKEMEIEREASKSFARVPINEIEVMKGASEGASIASAAEEAISTGTAQARKPGKKSSGRFVEAGLLLALLGGGGLLTWRYVRPAQDVMIASPTAASSALAFIPTVSVTVTDLPINSTPFPTATPVPTATPAPSSTAAAPTPRPTARPPRTPRPGTAVVVSAASPAPTPGEDEASTGIVKLDSDPWGEIFVDGKDTSRQTPAFDLKLPVGRHEIRLVNSVRKLEARVTVFVEAKSPQKIAVKLAPLQ